MGLSSEARALRGLVAAQPHRHAALTPGAGARLEHAGAGRAAARAGAFGREVPGGDLVPVAADQPFAAGMAIGALAGLVVDVPGVDVAQAVGERDLAPC